MKSRPRVPLEAFYPQTFRIDLTSEYDKFISAYKQDGELCVHHYWELIVQLSDSALWICKPTGANQGKGIFLVRDLQQVLTRLDKDRMSSKHHVARIVQRSVCTSIIHNRHATNLLQVYI